jgi:hypothetical protein
VPLAEGLTKTIAYFDGLLATQADVTKKFAATFGK